MECQPGMAVGPAVEVQALDIWCAVGRFGGIDVDVATGEVERGLGEERAAERQHVDTGDLRIKANCGKDVPGRHLAKVVVARVSTGRRVVEGEDGAAGDCLCLRGLPEPVVLPRRLESWLVAEKCVAGVR